MEIIPENVRSSVTFVTCTQRQRRLFCCEQEFGAVPPHQSADMTYTSDKLKHSKEKALQSTLL